MSSSSRKPGQYTIGSRAVAVAIMTEILDRACQKAGVAESEMFAFSGTVADELVSLAWDVEYKPHSERLVLIVDAGIQSERSRAEVDPPAERDDSDPE